MGWGARGEWTIHCLFISFSPRKLTGVGGLYLHIGQLSCCHLFWNSPWNEHNCFPHQDFFSSTSWLCSFCPVIVPFRASCKPHCFIFFHWAHPLCLPTSPAEDQYGGLECGFVCTGACKPSVCLWLCVQSHHRYLSFCCLRQYELCKDLCCKSVI